MAEQEKDTKQARYAILHDFISNLHEESRRVIVLELERIDRSGEEIADFKVAPLGDWTASLYGGDKRVVRYDNLGDAVKAAQFELVMPPSYFVHEQEEIMRRLGITEHVGNLPVDSCDFEKHGEYYSVVPIDEGEFTYREIGQEVKFGKPIITFVKHGKKVMVKNNYSIELMKKYLEDSIEKDDHWLPESLHW